MVISAKSPWNRTRNFFLRSSFFVLLSPPPPFLYHSGCDVLRRLLEKILRFSRQQKTLLSRRNDLHSGGSGKPPSGAHLVPRERWTALALAGWTKRPEFNSSILDPCRERVHGHRRPSNPQPPLNTPIRHFPPFLGSSSLQTKPSSRSHFSLKRYYVATEESKGRRNRSILRFAG